MELAEQLHIGFVFGEQNPFDMMARLHKACDPSTEYFYQVHAVFDIRWNRWLVRLDAIPTQYFSLTNPTR